MHKDLVASKLSYRVEVFLTGFRWYARGGASGSCQCLLKILIEGSAGFGALCGAEIAKGVAIGLLGTGPILLTSNLSDFINPCSVPFSAGITTPEASALASDSNSDLYGRHYYKAEAKRGEPNSSNHSRLSVSSAGGERLNIEYGSLLQTKSGLTGC